MDQNVDQNGNGKWRKMIKEMNVIYLNMIKEFGVRDSAFAQTALGLDAERLNYLISLDRVEIYKLAGCRGLLFRLAMPELNTIKNLFKRGGVERLHSVMATALAADDGQGGR